MQVEVTNVWPEPGSTVWRADGIDVETGDPVTFGGDWRPMREIFYALEREDELVFAEVPDWAVL